MVARRQVLLNGKKKNRRRWTVDPMMIIVAVVCIFGVQLSFIGMYYTIYLQRNPVPTKQENSKWQVRGPKYGPKRASIIERLLAPTKPPQGTVMYESLSGQEKGALGQAPAQQSNGLHLDTAQQPRNDLSLGLKSSSRLGKPKNDLESSPSKEEETEEEIFLEAPPPKDQQPQSSLPNRPSRGKSYAENLKLNQQNPVKMASHSVINRHMEKVYHNLLTPTYNTVEVTEMLAGLKQQDPDHRYGPCREGECDTINDSIRAYNPWNKHVFLCGLRVNPKSSVEVVDPCHEGPRMEEHEAVELEHKVCFDTARQITHPFVENLIEKHETEDHHEAARANEECAPGAFHPQVAYIGTWKRTVWYHDHVVDIALEGSSSDAYRISTTVDSKAEMLRPNVYQLKDSKTRVTLVVDPLILVSTKTEGALVLRTSHQSPQPKRLRVIVTDIDQPDGEKHTETMVDEFMHPVQFFRILPDQ